MKKTVIGLLIFALGLSGLAGCGNAGKATVTTDGSTSMEKTIGCLGEAFEIETGIRVTYNPTGSGTGIQAVLDGRCDIGLSSRELKTDELQEGLEGTVLAYDGIAILVHPDNPVSDLSRETLGAICKGEITDWSQIGGPAGEIVLIGREAGAGTRDGFEAAIDAKGMCKYRQELTSTGDVITTVSRNPGAIGYASVASVKENVKVVTIDGISPTDEHIATGSYKIRRPFILVTKKDASLSENARKFYDYMTSGEAEDIISFAGVVPANSVTE